MTCPDCDAKWPAHADLGRRVKGLLHQIHRDNGNHTNAVGVEQSMADAGDVVKRMIDALVEISQEPDCFTCCGRDIAKAALRVRIYVEPGTDGN